MSPHESRDGSDIWTPACPVRYHVRGPGRHQPRGGGEVSMPKPVFIARSVPRLTLQGARLVLAAATRRATAVGVPMDLAVVDDAGHLLAFHPMDGAKLSSIVLAN